MIASPLDLLGCLHAMTGDREDEFLHAFFLDRGNRLCWSETLAQGARETATIDFRGLICTGLRVDACGIILAHNHPSGVARPSPQDVTGTLDLKRVCDKIGITLIDHLIVAARSFFSFRSERLL